MIIEQKQSATAKAQIPRRGRKPKDASKGKGGGYRGGMRINSVENNNTRSEYSTTPNNCIVTKHNGAYPVPIETVNRIVEYLKEGYTIPEIAGYTGVSMGTVYRWIENNQHGTSEAYALARATRAARQAARAEEIATLCDGDSNSQVAKARLQVDLIKWQLEKNYPELYGDVSRIELTAKGTLAPTIGAAAIADAERLRNMIFGKRNADNPSQVVEGEIIGE